MNSTRPHRNEMAPAVAPAEADVNPTKLKDYGMNLRDQCNALGDDNQVPLIPLSHEQIGDSLVQTVNARELHSFLEVGKVFAAWIQDRIQQYAFIEDVDYVITVSKTGIRKNVIQKDYFLTLDMAKELSMVERNQKGKEARQYFIRCEKRAQQPQWNIPQTLPEALRLAAEQAEQVAILTIENKQQQVQIESLESLFRQGMTIPQFCKMLNGVNVMKVSEHLEEKSWLYNESRSGNSKRWRVASYARDRYLTEEQQQIGIHGYESFIKFTPVLLQAGAVRLYQLYVKNELPMKKDWDGTFTQDKVIKGAA